VMLIDIALEARDRKGGRGKISIVELKLLLQL